MTKISFSGQLSEQQFSRMQWLTTHWLVRHLGWIILGGGVMTLATGGCRVVAADPVGQGLRAIPWLLFVLFMLIAPRRAIRRNWRQNALIKGPVNGVADDAAIEWNSAFVTGRFPWDALLKQRQAEDMILVYTAPTSVLYFPKSFFADEEAWHAFRSLVASRLKSGE